MLTFITGEKGYPRSEFLIREKLSAAIESKKRVFLIVPRQITFQTDEMILDILGPKKACEVSVFSFKRLCEFTLKSISGFKNKPLKEGINAIIMSKALNLMKYKLNVYNKRTDSAFIQRILAQIKYFKNNKVSVEDLNKASIGLDDLLKKKIDDIALLYETYNSLISDEYYDENDLLSSVYEILKNHSFFADSVVAFDGFSGFSVQQMKIVELAVSTASEVYVTACSDDIFNTDISSPFSYVNNSMRRLNYYCESSDGSEKKASVIDLSDCCSKKDYYKSEAIALLEENIYRKDVLSALTDESVKLYEASTIDDECDYVAREIKKLIRSGEYRCSDLAIAFRSFDTYPSRLKNSMRKYGVPFFADKRQPVINSPLIIMVKALLELSIPGKFSTDTVFKLLKTGLLNVNEDDVSRLENYAFMWSLSGGDLKKPFVKNPFGFSVSVDEKSTLELESLNRIKDSFMPAILEFCADVQELNGIDFCKRIYRFLDENEISARLKEYSLRIEKSGNCELALEQGEVWDVLISILEDIASVIDESEVSPSAFSEYFDLVAETKSLGKLPSHFDEVTMCSFDRLMNYSPKVLFTVGLNENVFPSYGIEDSLFSDHEKKLIEEKDLDVDLFDSDINSVIYEHLLVYLSLSSPSDRLFLTCAKTNAAGETMNRSDIFSMVKRCLSEIDFVTEDRSLGNLIQSEASAYEEYLKRINEKTDESVSLSEFFSSNQAYKDRINTIDRFLSAEDFAITDNEISKMLFGRNMKLSASKVNSYYSCPFKYFCEYGLKLKSRKKETFDRRNLGNAVHEVFEKLLSKHTKDYFVFENEAELQSEADSILKDYLELKMGGAEDKSSRFLYLYFRVSKLISMSLKRMIFEFSNTDFEPVAFELNVGGKDGVNSLSIELEDGRIEIIGKIDRVDRFSVDNVSYIKIVDYKTNSNMTFSLADVMQGLNLQMVIYLIAIIKDDSDLFSGDVSPAGVLYSIINSDPLKETSADALKEFIDKAKQEGMLLDDDAVISAVSSNVKSKYYPVENKYTLEDFDLISKKVSSIISDMGNALHNGVIPSKPFLKEGRSPCDYCDYSSICMKQENVSFRPIYKEKFSDSIRRLREDATVEQVEQ